MVTYPFYCIFPKQCLVGKVWKKLFGNFYFWGITLTTSGQDFKNLWPNDRNISTQHIARPLRRFATYWTFSHFTPNNVAICYAEMLRSFGQSFTLMRKNMFNTATIPCPSSVIANTHNIVKTVLKYIRGLVKVNTLTSLTFSRGWNAEKKDCPPQKHS